MAQTCDFVYVVMVERLEKWAMVGQLMAALATLAGAEGVEVPDPFASRASFDEWLNSPLDEEPADQERRELHEALGIGS